jgi:hypothetical protein
VFLDHLAQVTAATVDHREIRATVLVPRIEYLDGVLVLQPAQGLYLGDEVTNVVARHEVFGDDLQGHDAVRRGALLGLVDDPHAAAAEPLEQLVRANEQAGLPRLRR